MKQTLTLFAALLLTMPSFAQHRHRMSLPAGAVTGYDFATRKATYAEEEAAASKGTNIASRLIAENDAYGSTAGSYVNSDSFNYSYSGTRGGDLSSPMKYDVETDYSWDTATNGYLPSYKFFLTYNTLNNFQSFLQQIWNGSSWDNDYRATNYTDVNGHDSAQKFEQFVNGVWTNDGMTTNTYVGNNLTAQTNQNWSGTAYVNSSRQLFTYNTAGLILTQVNQVWQNGQWLNDNASYVNTYNAAGKITSQTMLYYSAPNPTPVAGYRVTNHYNTSNQVISVVNSYQNAGAWIYSDSTYNTTLNGTGKALLSNTYAWTGSSWGLAGRTTNTYTSADLIATEAADDYNGGTWEPQTRGFYTYNTYNQLTRNYSQEWDGTSWKAFDYGARDMHYYYQNYNDGLGIENGKASGNNSLQVWPVPAADKLNVQFNVAGTQHYNVVITDVTGRLVSNWQGISTDHELRSVDVSGFSAGTYIIKVDIDGNSFVNRFTIKH